MIQLPKLETHRMNGRQHVLQRRIYYYGTMTSPWSNEPPVFIVTDGRRIDTSEQVVLIV